MTYHTIPDNPGAAAHNVRNILAALRDGRVCNLAPGVTYTDQVIVIPPELSPCTIQGCGRGVSVLKQIGQPWPGAGGILLWGTGFKDPGEGPADLVEGSLTVPYRGGEELVGQLVYVTGGATFGDPLTGEFQAADAPLP